MDYSLPVSSVHGIFQARAPGVGCHFLIQGIFPTQGSNPGLQHWRQTLYRLSHQDSPWLTIDLFLAVRDLHCCLRAFCSGEWGLLSSCGVQASHFSGFSCVQALELAGFGSCGTPARLLLGTWTLPSVHMHAQMLSHVQLFVTAWTVARQAPLSIGF